MELWNRVVTMTAPWIARKDSFGSEPSAFDRSVFGDGLDAIF
jgi:hypothetical protein